MSSLAEIKAAVDALTPDDQAALYRYIQGLVQIKKGTSSMPSIQALLSRPPLSLGAVLRPLDRGDDLLEEMLESRGVRWNGRQN